MKNEKTINKFLFEMNYLRGNMDVTTCRNYILDFIFYRFLSDKQEEYLERNEKNITEDKEEIIEALGYAIDLPYTWPNLIQRIEENQFEKAYLLNVIENLRCNSSDNLDNQAANIILSNRLTNNLFSEEIDIANIEKLILIVNDVTNESLLGNNSLGELFDYVLDTFAVAEGRNGSLFYTPPVISQLLTSIVTINLNKKTERVSVYDPTMGTGSLLIKVKEKIINLFGDTSVQLYGNEVNTSIFDLAMMNMFIHNVSEKECNFSKTDTLNTNVANDNWKAEAVILEPPFSAKWDNKTINRELDPRFSQYGVAPTSKADYAFILDGLYHLSSTGTMAVVVPHGVLFRGAVEEKIRKHIIENNLLDTVISLPSNLLYGTTIPTVILVFKGKDLRETIDILFIDASREYEKNKVQNKLNDEQLVRILDAYKNRISVDGYSHIAELNEIKKNNYNLNIPRYIDNFVRKETRPLEEIKKEIQLYKKEIQHTTNNLEKLFEKLDTK